MANKVEQNRIKQVAQEYSNKGYQVIVEPQTEDMPSFLDDYRPDLIARKDDDNVIIEVLLKDDKKALEKLKSFADRINLNDWRFELVVIDSAPKVKSDPNFSEEFSITDSERQFGDVEVMLSQNLIVPAFIFAWAAFESIARQLLSRDGITLKNSAPNILIKELYSLGYLSRADLDLTNKYFQIRNRVVHGYKPDLLSKADVKKLLFIIESLFHED